MKFIKLYCSDNNYEDLARKNVYVNADHIAVYAKSANGTSIKLINEATLEVIETPEQITDMIKEQRCKMV